MERLKFKPDGTFSNLLARLKLSVNLSGPVVKVRSLKLVIIRLPLVHDITLCS